MELISKDLFYTYLKILYYTSFFIAILGSLQIDVKNNQYLVNTFLKKLVILILVLFIILVGFRAYNVGVDTSNYYLFQWKLGFELKGLEIIFGWIISFIKYLNGSFTWFLLIVSFIFYFFIYKAYTIISKKVNTQTYFIFFCLVSFFFSTSLSTNVIRQGCSLSVLVYAYTLWIDTNNLKKVIPFLIISCLTHTTSIIPILIYILIILKFKNIDIKYFIVFYFVGVILALANFGVLTIAPFLKSILQDDGRAGYLTSEGGDYVVGFKPQFVAFNTVFLIIFYFISKKIEYTPIKNMYDDLFKYFLLSSFLFFMAFQIPFSDRWGLFGWISLPILSSPLFSFVNYTQTYRTIWVLFFGFIYLFFSLYG